MELNDPRIALIRKCQQEIPRVRAVWTAWCDYVGGWKNKRWEDITGQQADEAIAWIERVKVNPLLIFAVEYDPPF